MIVRPMREDELAEVVPLETACFSEPWTEAGFRESMETGRYIFLTAQSDAGEFLGYAVTQVTFEDAELLTIAVKPEARGQGAGHALVRATAEKAVLMGAEKILLEVRPSNTPALALYESEGFAQIHVIKNFYRSPVENALLMEKRLDAAENTAP